MSESQLSDEQDRLAKAQAFFAAEEKMLNDDEREAERVKKEKGSVKRLEGESTGEWLVRRDNE